MKKTWLFIIPWSLDHVGGVNQVVINLAREMLENETFRPVILVSDWSAKDPIFRREHGLDIVYWRIRPSDNLTNLKNKISYKLSRNRFSSKLLEFCSQNKVQVINFHYVGGTVFTVFDVLQDWDNDIQLLLSFHGTDVTSLENAPLNNLQKWIKFLPNQNIITCSKNLGYRLQSVVGKNFNIDVIHNGLNFNALPKSKLSKNDCNEKIILNVGKFEDKKGQKILVEAFSRCKKEFTTLRLILIGGSGPELSQLRQLVESKGLTGSVDIIENLPHAELLKYYEKADIFVLSSLQESFGIVVLEAGYYELPVIATSVGGVPEIITDGINGIFVEPRMADQLEERLKELLNSPDKSKELGSSLQTHVLANFSWKAAHDKYMQLVASDQV